MRKLILVCALFLAACASDSKNESNTVDSNSGDIEATAGIPPESSKTGNESSNSAAAAKASVQGQPLPSASYKALSDAYKGQNDDAIEKAATQLLGQNPSDLKALNAMGLFHYRKGHFLAARYFFSRAQTSAPKSAEVMNNQGMVSLALDDQHEAIKDFKKALDLNPNSGIAAANLGSIYVQEKDYRKAQIALELALKKGMRETRTLNNYGIALAASGQNDPAKRAYEDALKMNSNNQEAMYNLAALLIDRMNKSAEGMEQLNRLRFLGPGPELRNKTNALENRAKAGIQ